MVEGINFIEGNKIWFKKLGIFVVVVLPISARYC